MEQIEVVSWKTLNAIKQVAKMEEVIGDLDTNEQMAVFCTIEEDYLELYYSESENNYIRHFEDEKEFLKNIDLRKNEFGEEDFDPIEFYDEDGYENQTPGEDLSGYKVGDENDDDF
ncbi:MAG: hypothetical protein KAT34_18630 [Candidatus Aminicenantes bacterium]|nr:hypothetical protein [Candidatus Aminicenantes bacterium]